MNIETLPNKPKTINLVETRSANARCTMEKIGVLFIILVDTNGKPNPKIHIRKIIFFYRSTHLFLLATT